MQAHAEGISQRINQEKAFLCALRELCGENIFFMLADPACLINWVPMVIDKIVEFDYIVI
jgi:hypothetical protein